MATQIDFIGYSGDCRVEGRLDLEDARLADLLNRQYSIVLRNAVVVSHRDGQRHEVGDLEIAREELDAVVASGPRGDPARRLATRPNGVEVKLGPYVAEGFLHAPSTANPVSGIERRPPIIALTDAQLEYSFCDEPVAERFETLLVNRHLAGSVKAAGLPGTV